MLHTLRQSRLWEYVYYPRLFFQFPKFTFGGIVLAELHHLYSGLTSFIFIYLFHALATYLMIKSDSLVSDLQMWSTLYYSLNLHRIKVCCSYALMDFNLNLQRFILWEIQFESTCCSELYQLAALLEEHLPAEDISTELPPLDTITAWRVPEIFLKTHVREGRHSQQ